MDCDDTLYCPQCGNKLELRSVDRVDQLARPETDCHYVHWHNPVPVVAGVIVYNHSLLLARNRQWPAGRFSLITGHVERHEAPEQAIRRELPEALGLVTDTVQFVGHYLFKRKNQLLIAYTLKAHGEPKLGDEIAEIRMFPISDVAQHDFSPFELTRTIVQDWLKSSTSPN
ncbi:MAG: NUDIX domain-containing protein [Nitrospira sp.]